MTKQSFAPALLVGFVLVCDRRRSHGRAAVGRRHAAALLLAPALCYACTEAVAGGLRPMLQQMLHARPAYGTALVSVLWHGGAQVSLLVIAATILCVLEARWAPESQGHRIAALAAHAAR